MLKADEEALLRRLRANSRLSVASLAKEWGVPQATLSMRLKRIERYICRNTTLVDFARVGHNIQSVFLMRAQGSMDKALLFLLQDPHINNACLIDHNRVYAECFFRNMGELTRFRESLLSAGLTEEYNSFVVDVHKWEGFLLDQ